METAGKIKNLVKHHVERDDDTFNTLTLQIAAREARIGHDAFAGEHKGLVGKNI